VDVGTREEYRQKAKFMGRREFTLFMMQKYGFWPKDLPTPSERQKDETQETYERRRALFDELDKIAKQITELYGDKAKIEQKLRELAKQSAEFDYEKIRKKVASEIMRESIERRAERKRQRELQKEQASREWAKLKSENILYIGKGYSKGLSDKETNTEKLKSYGLPIITDDKALAELLDLEYKELRFLTYHRDVVTVDHYYRFQIPKRNGKMRNIAAPKSKLKNTQRKILSELLEKVEISNSAHGFYKGRSVLTGAQGHISQPKLLINIDLENFFPSITFQRVRGMFKAFGYSGYISSLLSMLCTYCERMPIEVKGQVKYVKTSDRILPQGSPASPMITNIICRRLDQKMNGLEEKYGFFYSRYADDMSFSFKDKVDDEDLRKIVYKIQGVVFSEGLRVNKEKTHYLGQNSRQCVTGIVVNNEEPGVPKVWVKKLRAALHNANKLIEKGQFTASDAHEISGMASWLKSVNPNRYSKIIAESNKILDIFKKRSLQN